MPSEWYYQTDDLTIGPLSATELQREFSEGNVHSDTLIRQGLEGRWQPARRYLKHAEGRRKCADPDLDREPPPLPPRPRPIPARRKDLTAAPHKSRRPLESEGDRPANGRWSAASRGVAFLLGLVLLGVTVKCVPGLEDFSRDLWVKGTSKQPDRLIVGRWEHTSANGNRHSAVFFSDGIAKFDGQPADEDYMRHLKYKFVDDHTIAFLATEDSLRALKEHFPEARDRLQGVRVGDELSRITISFPTAKEMRFTQVDGTSIVWKKSS